MKNNPKAAKFHIFQIIIKMFVFKAFINQLFPSTRDKTPQKIYLCFPAARHWAVKSVFFQSLYNLQLVFITFSRVL